MVDHILLPAILGSLVIGGAVIGFVVALLSRARSRVWVSMGGAFGTFFGMGGLLGRAGFTDITSGGGHGGAVVVMLALLLFGGPLGAIFGSLLVRKLTGGGGKSPRKLWIALSAVVVKRKGLWMALATVIVIGIGIASQWDSIKVWYLVKPGADLQGHDFSYCYLWEMDLTNAGLRRANLTGADLRGASGINLSGTIGTPAFIPGD